VGLPLHPNVIALFPVQGPRFAQSPLIHPVWTDRVPHPEAVHVDEKDAHHLDISVPLATSDERRDKTACARVSAGIAPVRMTRDGETAAPAGADPAVEYIGGMTCGAPLGGDLLHEFRDRRWSHTKATGDVLRREPPAGPGKASSGDAARRDKAR